MATKLYVVHGSHPCDAVRRAMDLKGIDYKIVEFPPPFHVPLQRLRFGKRTVPGVVFEDGEKVTGSTAIMRRLDEMVPEPRLFGDERVAEAEAWGESVLQPLARQVLWPAFARNPAAMVGYQEGGKLPALPGPVVRALAPVVTRIERKLNDATDENVRAGLQELPAHLERVDGWIADGVLGGNPPNAADLQIASSLALLMTVADVRVLMEDRPAADLARRLFGGQPGEVPAGTLPADWLPANSAMSAASLPG